MSRADQSLSPTRPKTWSAKSSWATGLLASLPTPTTKPSSASMSSRLEGLNVTAPVVEPVETRR